MLRIIRRVGCAFPSIITSERVFTVLASSFLVMPFAVTMAVASFFSPTPIVNTETTMDLGAQNLTTTGIGTFSSLQQGDPATDMFKLSDGGAVETALPSYDNTGGRGNRSAMITATSDLTWQAGGPAEYVDGAYDLYNAPANNEAVTGKYIKFDFGTGGPYLITEAFHSQSHAYAHGTWKWQGSNNDSDWTDIGSTFTLGSTTYTNYALTELSGNTNYYRYYRLLGTAGNWANANIHQYEMQFKIAKSASLNATLGQTYITDGLTADGNFLFQKDGGSVLIGTTKLFEDRLLQVGDYFGVNSTGDIVAGSIELTDPTKALSFGGTRFATIYGRTNICIGASGKSTMTGGGNLLWGQYAGQSMTSGNTNVVIGDYAAGHSLTSGSSNVFIGGHAGRIYSTASEAVIIGAAAGYSATAAGHVAIGASAGYGSTQVGTFVGYRAGLSHTSGLYDSAFGYDALYSNATGERNTAMGFYAGRLLTSSYNTLFGALSGAAISTGASNVYLGYYAGGRQTTASNQLIIDNQDRTSSALELTNALIYGTFNATVSSQQLTVNAGNVYLPYDNEALWFGAGNDAKIYYDGTNLVIDPKVVGTGAVNLNGGGLTTTGIGTFGMMNFEDARATGTYNSSYIFTTATTVSGAHGSNPATLNVVSTAGFPSSGWLGLAASAIPVYYTGTTATSFTGCVWGEFGNSAYTPTDGAAVIENGAFMMRDNGTAYADSANNQIIFGIKSRGGAAIFKINNNAGTVSFANGVLYNLGVRGVTSGSNVAISAQGAGELYLYSDSGGIGIGMAGTGHSGTANIELGKNTHLIADDRKLYFGAGNDVYSAYTGTYWDFDIAAATSAIRFNQSQYDTDFIVYGDTAAIMTLDAGTLGATFGGTVDAVGFKAGGTDAVADGTYNIDGSAGGTVATITTKGGIITAITTR